jgi:ribosomal protein S18 acetylase RimI-like enzyme
MPEHIFPIRPLCAVDRAKIHAILTQRGTFNAVEIQVALEVLDDAIAHPEGDYWVYCAIDVQNSVTGYICFGPIPLTEGCFDLYWIAVEEESSRRGVGALLLRHMEGLLRQHGARHVYVDTSSTPAYEAARAFYEKHGYHKACIFQDFYRIGDHKVLYMKDLQRALTP